MYLQLWLIGQLMEKMMSTKEYKTTSLSLAETRNSDSTEVKLPASCSVWCIRKGKVLQNIVSNNLNNHARCIALFTLLLSGDVELNPGPVFKYNKLDVMYLCPFCEDKVDDSMRVIQCDGCDMWYHKTCISMCTQNYQNLENNSKSYICCRCSHANYYGNLSSFEVETFNSFECLSQNTSEILNVTEPHNFKPKYCSSPNQHKRTNQETISSANNDTIVDTSNNDDSTDTDDPGVNHENALPPKESNFRSLVVNANSVRNKIADIEYLISHSNPDQILLTETKLGDFDKEINNTLKSKGYKPYRKDRKAGGGGLIIAIKECYSHDEIELSDITESDLKFEDHPCVINWIEVDQKNNKKLYTGVFYRQPDREIEQLQLLEKSINIIKDKMKNNANSILMLGGDFNLGDIDWEDNYTIKPNHDYNDEVYEKLLKIIADNALTQHQLEPTRNGRILDLFLTNQPGIVQNMFTLPGISDHDIPIADCDIKPSYNKNKRRTIYNLKKADWERIKEETREFRDEFLQQYKNRSVDKNWYEFKKHIMSVMEKHIPKKSTSIRHNLLWMNASLKRMVKKKQRLYNKAKKSHKRKDWDTYNTHKKETLKSMRKARWKYINKILLEGMEDNNKPFWRYLKSKQKEHIGVAPLKNNEGILAKDSKEKAEILNTQFQSVFTHDDAEKELPKMDGPEYPRINELVINENGVEKLLSNLKVNKASGPDDLPATVLKELSHEIAPILTVIFTQSLQTGSLPKDWLKANVAPIFKKGNRHLAENYRPVSLTCVCCKVMEHIICRHMLNHLDLHQILTSLQHGFRNGYSCETQLLVTLHDLMKNRDSKVQTDIVILDFSKAFDTVPHDKLLLKLKHYGINGNILEWITSFLKQREQRVVVDGKCSNWIHVDSGVPQGTVLGPLLFLLYINDLPNCISKDSIVRLFADDCILYRKIKTLQDQVMLQRDLDKLHEWAEKWGMKFNPSKCEVMRINHSKKNMMNRFYTINGQVLQQVKTTKYLGIMISDDLGWTPHVEYVTAKANRALGLIMRNFKECPKQLRETAYFTMVRSVLDYASSIWDPHFEKDTQTVEKVQRRAARFVQNDYRIYLHDEQQHNSVTKMINDLGWNDLAERRRHIRLTLFYKIVTETVNVPYEDVLKTTGRETRQGKTGQKFIEIQTSTDDYKYSFFPRTTQEWNKLPNHVINAPSVETFKNRLKAIPIARD